MIRGTGSLSSTRSSSRRGDDVGARRSAAAPAPDDRARSRSAASRPAWCSIRRRPSWRIENVAGDVDYVLVMSVNPGFGGQTFIPRSVEKIRAVRALLDRGGQPGARSRSTAAIDLHTVARVVDGGRRAAGGRPGDIRRRPARAGRRASAQGGGRALALRCVRSVRLIDRARTSVIGRPRALRRDRQDGRRLLRPLSRVVRDRPHRLAARNRLDLSRDGSRRSWRCR